MFELGIEYFEQNNRQNIINQILRNLHYLFVNSSNVAGKFSKIWYHNIIARLFFLLEFTKIDIRYLFFVCDLK